MSNSNEVDQYETTTAEQEADKVSVKITPQVRKTEDYSIFERLSANRGISPGHVSKLMMIFTETPDAIKHRPILVNEKLEVIDGQHRLKALSQLGLPVYYQIGVGLTLADAITMNAHQKQWNNTDYAISYASQGNPHYASYLKYRRLYQLPHSETSLLVSGIGTSKFRNFSLGKFVAELNDSEVVRRFDEYTSILALLPPIARGRTIARAYLEASNSPQYDHDRMIHKLEKAGNKYFNQNFSIVPDALRAFEGCYNEFARESDKIRLF